MSTYSERLRITSDGNVGIGVSDPDSKLEIKGSGGALGLTFKTTDASSNETFWINDGGRVGVRYGPLLVGIPSGTTPATSAVFQVEEAGLLTVLSTGKVGIGTPSPESLLTIQNDDAGIRLRSNTTTAKGLTLRYNHAGNFGQLLVDHQGNNQLAMKYYALSHSFGRSDSDVNVIMDDSGRLLVGSTTTDASTSERFLVKSTGGEHSRFVNSSDTYSTVYIKNTSTTANTNQPFLTFQDTGGNRGNFGLRYSTAQLFIQGHGGVGIAGGSGFTQDPDLFVNSSGNIGIGTSAPDTKLHIKQTSSGNFTEALRIENSGGGANEGNYIQWEVANTSGYGPRIGGRREGTGGVGLHFYTGEINAVPTEAMIIDHDGNVEVRSGAALKVYRDTNAASAQLFMDAGEKLYIRNSYANKDLVFDRDGKLGIGTDTPDQNLTVKAANAKISAQSTADGQRIGFQARYLNHTTLYGSFEYTTGDAQLYIDNNFQGNNGLYSNIRFRNCPNGSSTLTDRMIIQGSTGNVGIGTDNPAAKLHISGNSDVSDENCQLIIDDVDGSAGSRIPSIQFRSVTGGTTTNQGRIRATDTQGMILSGSSAQGDDLVVQAGKVGIGTTGPASLLHVKGTQSYGSIRVSPTSTNGESAIAFFKDTAGTTTGTAWVVGHAGWGHTGDFVIGNQAFGGPIMLIEAGGKVGIGTTTPAAALEVVRGSAGYAGIFGAPQGSGKVILFKDNHATPNKYNWLVGSQYNINNAFEITPSTVVGGYTFNDPGLSIGETGVVTVKQLHTTATAPMSFLSNSNTGTYNRTVLYSNQNNTGSNFNNGMHIEMGRISDSSSAEVRAFVIGARGGQSSFKVTERAAGVTQADGDYLVKMHETGADGYVDLFTGNATPVIRTRIASYGTSYFTPTGTTASNQAAVSVGESIGAKAGVLNVRSTSSVAGGIRHRMAGGTQYLNIASTHTGSGSLPYWHLKTNAYYNQNVMFVARVHGYAYGNSGHVIDMQRSGYAYSGSSTALVGSQFVNNGSGTVDSLVAYYTSAGQLCFRAYAGASSYYTGMAFDIKMQSPTGYDFDFVIEAHNLNTTSGNYYT